MQICWAPWAEPERPSENSFGGPRRPQPRSRPTGASNGGLSGQGYLACCFFLTTIHALALSSFVDWHPRTLTGAFTDAFWPRPTLLLAQVRVEEGGFWVRRRSKVLAWANDYLLQARKVARFINKLQQQVTALTGASAFQTGLRAGTPRLNSGFLFFGGGGMRTRLGV